MFKRIALKYLREWAQKDERKPLVLRGARQVGKTTLVRMFAKEFDNYIYLNLEEKENGELFAADNSLKICYRASSLRLMYAKTANAHCYSSTRYRTNQRLYSHYATSTRSVPTSMLLQQDLC